MESTDSNEKPFGAMVHMDFIILRAGSRAASSCPCALIVIDEKTRFVGIFPNKHHDADAVCDSVHQFDGAEPSIRRWWTDNAGEFVAASRRLRAQRLLAHFTSIPFRHETNGVAEVTNRAVIEGGRCLLVQAGLPDTWWTCAC